MTTTAQLRKIIPHHESLSQYLPYGTYDPTKNLYFDENYNLGFFIFETAPLAYPDKNFIETTANLLTQKTWPKKSIFQSTTYADPNMDRLLDGYMRLRGERGFCRTEYSKFLYDFSSSTCDFYKNHVHEGIHPQTHPVPFRNFRSFLSIQVPCSTSDFVNGKNSVDVLYKAKNLLASNLRAVSVPFIELQPDQLLPLLYEIWNMGKKAPANMRWNKDLYLRDQIIRSDTLIETNGTDLCKINDYYVKVKTPQQYPQFPDPFTIQQLVGEINNSNTKQVKCPFMLTTYVNLDPANEQIKKKGSLIMTQQASTALLGPKHQNKQQEYINAIDRMDNKGETFLSGGVIFAAFSPSLDLLKDAVDAIDTIWEGAGFTAQNEFFVSLPMFMACVPGGLLHGINDLRRAIPATAKTWAMMVADQADSKGTKTPTMLFSSRRGQLMTMDLRDSDTNFNAVVFAPSGSGKSFFTNNIIVSTLSTGGRAYLIDIGRSYQKLAESLDGQIIEFKKDSDINLNLFHLITRGVMNDDKVRTEKEILEATEYETTSRRQDSFGFDEESLRALLHRLLCQMAFPKTEMNDHQKSVLGNVLDKSINALQEGEHLSVDAILDKLGEKVRDDAIKNDDTANKLYECLWKYGSKGIYARWFSGAPNLNLEKSLVVLELEELRSDPDLREVILLLIMGIIDHQLYIENDRSRHTLVVLDEAWDLLNGANSAPFIETGYRRARKYLGSYVLITQSRKDLLKYPALGDAIVNNSAFLFYLSQKSSDIDDMKENNLLALPTEHDYKLLKQVHTVKGVYSEIGVIFPTGAFSVMRLIVSDKTKMLFTTDPNDIYVINRLKDLSYTLNEALDYAIVVLDIMKKRAVAFEDAYISTLDAEVGKAIRILMNNGSSLEVAILEVMNVLKQSQKVA